MAMEWGGGGIDPTVLGNIMNACGCLSLLLSLSTALVCDWCPPCCSWRWSVTGAPVVNLSLHSRRQEKTANAFLLYVD